MKKRSSSSCARRRSTNSPIWLPTLVSIDSRSSSGARISRLKNSITLSTSPRSRIGNPNAACRPSRAATCARGKLVSCTTSGIQAGSPLAQTRPGSPTPRANVEARLMASNSGKCGGGSRPDLRAAKDVGAAIDGPERAVLPVRALRRWPRGSSGRLRRTWTLRPAPGQSRARPSVVVRPARCRSEREPGVPSGRVAIIVPAGPLAVGSVLYPGHFPA